MTAIRSVGIFLFGLLLAVPVAATQPAYRGFCVASAAIAIDPSHMIVASDDFQSLLPFQRGNPTLQQPFALGDDVTDIEAAARINDTIFWLTSHSLNSSGEDKAKRKVLFSTKVSPSGALTKIGTPYRELREDIITALKLPAAQVVPRFNIEGMADTPDGHLLVGLRGPRAAIGDEAIIVEISNSDALMSLSDTKAAIARVVSLDLSDGAGSKGRGIRDMARVANRYLIIAGSEPDGGDPQPRLFWWDGKSKIVTPGPAADFAGMTPEAVVIWDEHEGTVLSDNGGATIDGKKCSDKNPSANASFPSVDITF